MASSKSRSQSPQVAATASQPSPLFRDAASPEPEPYAGDPGSCSGFLFLVELAFWSPRTFIKDTTRISYLVGNLRNRALSWAEAYLSRNLLPFCHYDVFLGEFKRTFAHPARQGDCSVSVRVTGAWRIISSIFAKLLLRQGGQIKPCRGSFSNHSMTI